jgi:hypothetical protein
MNRPRIATGMALLQLLLALGMAALSVFLLFLTRSPEITQDPDAAETIWGLKVGAAVLSVPALILSYAAFGMWKGRLWGWYLALTVDLVLLLFLVYSTVDDGLPNVDGSDLAVTAAFVTATAGLLLPRVRKFYRRGPGVQP